MDESEKKNYKVYQAVIPIASQKCNYDYYKNYLV